MDTYRGCGEEEDNVLFFIFCPLSKKIVENAVNILFSCFSLRIGNILPDFVLLRDRKIPFQFWSAAFERSYFKKGLFLSSYEQTAIAKALKNTVEQKVI